MECKSIHFEHVYTMLSVAEMIISDVPVFQPVSQARFAMLVTTYGLWMRLGVSHGMFHYHPAIAEL